MPAKKKTREGPVPGTQEDVERLLRQLEAFRLFIRQCGACQAEVPQTWQYCAHCGLRLATQCPGCGNPLPPKGARFCPHCGLAIPSTANPS